MKQYINRFLLLAGCTMALTACDENTWNNEIGDFEVPSKDPAETVEYTLTAVDYKTLAGLAENKKLAGDDADLLAAVGTQGYFTNVITPQKYLPAFLAAENFPYFALNNGSSVKVTYQMGGETPAQVTGVANAKKYVVSDEDYQTVWGSENDYTPSFAPSHTAAKSLPAVLKAAMPGAVSGDYVIVNYNTSDTDPVFTQAPEPDVPGFTLSNVLGSLTNGQAIDVNGVVAAVSTQGPVVYDEAGSVFVYRPSNNNDLKVGDQVVISSTIGGYNSGFQVAQGSTPEVQGSQAVTYPTAKVMTAAEMEARANIDRNDFQAPIYAKFEGTVTVTDKGYINVILAGTQVQLSPYGLSTSLKTKFTDGAKVTVTGYVVSVSTSGGVKFLNVVVSDVNGTKVENLNTASAAATRVVTVASTSENAVYAFDGSKWAPAPDVTILNHADYQAMGQSYDNLSNEGPAQYLPTYMKQKFPYAQEGDSKFVVYNYYASSETTVKCQQMELKGGQWVMSDGSTTETAQFVKLNGKWMFDPNVTIVLPAGRNQPLSTLYFQACVDWVRDNVPDGSAYISSYGNNDYYTGASAYQGNVDLRPMSAKQQYAGYKNMTDEEVVALEKKRFESEVMPAVLSQLHPDAAPVDGLEVLYTIEFSYYTGTTTPATLIYEVVGKGKFQFISCTWNETEEKK